MRPLRILAFAAVEVALAPVTAAAYAYLTARIAAASRRAGLSMTAASPLGVRWLLHELGRREDDAARRLFERLPGMSRVAARLTLLPTVLAWRLSGYLPGVLRYPFDGPSDAATMLNARTTFFDRALAEGLGGVEQVVLLGAGWDTRAYGLPGWDGQADGRLRGVTRFEVDAPATQRQKRALLQAAGLAGGRVTFVEADFNRGPWLDPLAAAGFNRARPAFVLWEGVTYYLGAEAVSGTLRAVAGLAPGSQVAFDYFSRGWVEGADAPLWVRLLRPLLRVTGEEWRFGLPTAPDARAEAARFVAAHGLRLERWAPYGDPAEPFGGLVLATVPAR